MLIAVESKTWIDEQGREKARAGFAKVVISRETTINAQKFVDEAIESGSIVNTDGGSGLVNLKHVNADHQVMHGMPERLNRWLPWTHRFISNAKSWLIGTHHGIKAKYLPWYLAETTYRFNRRHDLDGLFHRALTACAIASPVRLCALSG